jgi:hypothetical protein
LKVNSSSEILVELARTQSLCRNRGVGKEAAWLWGESDMVKRVGVRSGEGTLSLLKFNFKRKHRRNKGGAAISGTWPLENGWQGAYCDMCSGDVSPPQCLLRQ